MTGSPQQYESHSAAKLTALWTKAQPTVLAFVLSMVHRFEDAEDIVQQVGMTAAERFADYDETRSFQAWVLGIARLKVLRYYRDNRRHNALLVDQDLLDQMIDLHTERSDRVNEINVALESCLKKLTNRAMKMLELRYVRELSSNDIADYLGTTSNTISVTLHRIRKALRKCMAGQQLAGETPS